MFATIDTNRVHVRLSRRNLCDLQASLDDPDVRNKFLRRRGDNGVCLVVEVEDDARHYQGRDQGPGFAPLLRRAPCDGAELRSGAPGDDSRLERPLGARRVGTAGDILTVSQELSNRAAWNALMGVLTAAAGVVIVVYPIATVAASRLLLGPALIVAALVRFAIAFTPTAIRGRRGLVDRVR